MSQMREVCKAANRIVIKAGTSVVSKSSGLPSLHRLGMIVEQIADLVGAGKQVLFVSSGAVGVGRNVLSRQALSSAPMADHMSGRAHSAASTPRPAYSAACAAAGQLGLMSLYATLFATHNVAVAQLLVTSAEFAHAASRANVRSSLETMLSCAIVPIINENDAVSANAPLDDMDGDGECSFRDNDMLAALVARELEADLVLFLSDVDGVYSLAPSNPAAVRLSRFSRGTPLEDQIEIGENSAGGRGGMGAKLHAAEVALDGGPFCTPTSAGPGAAVIVSGYEPDRIRAVLAGQDVGTLFLPKEADAALEAALASAGASSSDGSPGSPSGRSRLLLPGEEADPKVQARDAREGGRVLAGVNKSVRSAILVKLADLLEERADEILEANGVDVSLADVGGLAGPLLKRLKLTKAKLASVADGVRSLANDEADPLDSILSSMNVSDSLLLNKVSVPIGVLLIIFESRPDCLPQIAALAIRSGNGLLLKGGSEARASNTLLHSLVVEALETGDPETPVPGATIGLVHTRSAISDLLALSQYIDLVIPRGSGELVKHIQSSTTIPVLGHAEGVCHVYIDAEADKDVAVRVAVDAKTSYPAACNAAETILFHVDTLENPDLVTPVLRKLSAAGVRLLGGPRAAAAGLVSAPDAVFGTEYGDLQVTIEIVDSMEEAIAHIHTHGSGHTESIVTGNEETAAAFLAGVDAACVFHNASTRFADGRRFGLGAEVGISTGRIHARGPVGVEGLLTTKWTLVSSSGDGDVVADYEGDGQGVDRPYLHAVVNP